MIHLAASLLLTIQNVLGVVGVYLIVLTWEYPSPHNARANLNGILALGTAAGISLAMKERT